MSLYEFDITFVMLFVMLPQLPYNHGLVDRVTGLNCRDSSLIPGSAKTCKIVKFLLKTNDGKEGVPD